MKTVEALDVVYVTKGFLEAMYRKANWRDLWKEGSEPEGEAGFLQAVADSACLLEQVYAEISERWDGMWLYEVAEPFGAWLAEQYDANKEFPSDEACRKFIRQVAGV